MIYLSFKFSIFSRHKKNDSYIIPRYINSRENEEYIDNR